MDGACGPSARNVLRTRRAPAITSGTPTPSASHDRRMRSRMTWQRCFGQKSSGWTKYGSNDIEMFQMRRSAFSKRAASSLFLACLACAIVPSLARAETPPPRVDPLRTVAPAGGGLDALEVKIDREKNAIEA